MDLKKGGRSGRLRNEKGVKQERMIVSFRNDPKKKNELTWTLHERRLSVVEWIGKRGGGRKRYQLVNNTKLEANPPPQKEGMRKRYMEGETMKNPVNRHD